MKKILKRNQIMITALALMIAVAGYLHFAGEKLGEDEAVALTDTYSEELEQADITRDISDEDLLQVNSSLDADAVLTDDYLDETMAEMMEDGAAATDGTVADGAAATDGTVADGAAATDGTVATAGTGAADGTVVADGTGTDIDSIVENPPGEAVFTSTASINSFSGAKLLKEQTRAKNKEVLLEIINNVNIDETQKAEAIAGMIELTDIAEKETASEILLDAKGYGDCVVSISDGSVDVFVYAVELSDTQRAQIEDIVKRKTGVEASNIIITPVDAE